MLLHQELSYKIIGICFEIYNEYGPAHNERIYQNLIVERLEINHILFDSQPKIPVYSRQTGKKIGLYIPDLLIDNKIIIELKTKYFNSKSHEKQVFEYLKISPYEIAYLINFKTQPKLYYKRFIYTNDHKNFLTSELVSV